MTVEEMIAVLQAYQQCKAIQCRGVGRGDTWADTSAPAWDFRNFDYRVRPGEPLEFLIGIDKNNGTVLGIYHELKSTNYVRAIRVREVIE